MKTFQMSTIHCITLATNEASNFLMQGLHCDALDTYAQSLQVLKRAMNMREFTNETKSQRSTCLSLVNEATVNRDPKTQSLSSSRRRITPSENAKYQESRNSGVRD